MNCSMAPRQRRMGIGLIAMAMGGWSSPAGAQALCIEAHDAWRGGDARTGPVSVLVQGARIQAVRAKRRCPKRSEVVRVEGLLTPGLVHIGGRIGMSTLGDAPASAEARSSWPIQASFRAAPGLDVRDAMIGVARRQGIVRALSLPAGGIVHGRGAWLGLHAPSTLGDRPVEDAEVVAAMFGTQGIERAGGERARWWRIVDDAWDDAIRYRRHRAAFDRAAAWTLSQRAADLEALGPLLDGRMRLFVRASRASDIAALVEWAERRRVSLAVVGGAEAWLVAKRLRAAKVPVVLDPMRNLPGALDARWVRDDLAARLVAAGVRVAITRQGLPHGAGELRFHAAEAVRRGLSWGAAMRAVTLEAAAIAGRSGDFGCLEAGCRADLVAWVRPDGAGAPDPFQPHSHAARIWIDGRAQPVDSRQTALARRYLGAPTPR